MIALLASIPEEIRGAGCLGIIIIVALFFLICADLDARRRIAQRELDEALKSAGNIHPLTNSQVRHGLSGHIVRKDVGY